MDKTVRNIKELADYLGLSATTVSRVLNGKASLFRISDATSKKVLDAASLLHYRPNKIARGLKLTRTETLGLIIPDIANPFFASIAKIIELESRKHGYSLILCDSLDDTATEQELLQLMWGRKVDGIIMAPVGLQHEHIDAVSQMGIPVLIIDRIFQDSQLAYVTTDNYEGAYEAVKHLINHGHKRIACIQGIHGISANNLRVQGYLDALSDHSLLPDKSYIVGQDFGEENGYIHTRMLMDLTNPPTAILALSNLISLGVLRALQESGLRVPDDVSLISFDEQPYSAFLSTPLTTIEQPWADIALLAVHRLLKQIEEPSEQEKTAIVLKPRLILRDSVKRIHN